MQGNGIGLVIGLLVTFYGGLGVGHAAQDAMNRVWAVPIRVRPGFFPQLLRSLALIGTLGVGILVTTVSNRLGSAHGATWERRARCFVLGDVRSTSGSSRSRSAC